MRNLTKVILLLLISYSCNQLDEIPLPPEEIETKELGSVKGFIRLSTEYGLHPFGEEESCIVSLTNSNEETIELETSIDDRRFEFNNLEHGRYKLQAESSTYKSCEVFEFEVSKEKLVFEKELELKSVNFVANLNSFEVDSLVGNRLYHSFDIDKDNNKTLGIRFYLSDQSNVTNQNYKETIWNLAAWTSPETSGQYYLFREITPELYEGDSIYISMYLVNNNSVFDGCVGDDGLIYHYPFSQKYLTVGFEK